MMRSFNSINYSLKHLNRIKLQFELSYFKSNKNTISNNIIRDNYCGIFNVPCNKNSIVNNTISGSECGLIFDASFYNIIRKNNFINNNHSIRLINSSFNLLLKNYWDDWNGKKPYVIEGISTKNFWKLMMYYCMYMLYLLLFGEEPPFQEPQLEEFPTREYDWNPAKEPYDT